MKIAIAGEPGVVCAFDRRGRCLVDWVDLDMGRWTTHAVDSLILDESFQVAQRLFDFGEWAA